MSTAGRHRVLDDVKRREICALISAGCGISDAARYVGCSASTIQREALRNPDFKKQLRGAEVHSQLQSLQAMRKAANSHWRAAAWMLERSNPRRFSRPHFKTYRAEDLRDAIEHIIETAVEAIEDADLRDRICRRWLVASHHASRALDEAVERRRLARKGGPRLTSFSEERSVAKLMAELDEDRDAAYRYLFEKSQNRGNFAAEQSEMAR